MFRKKRREKVAISAEVLLEAGWQRCWVVRVHDTGEHFEIDWGLHRRDMMQMGRSLATRVCGALAEQPGCRNITIEPVDSGG